MVSCVSSWVSVLQNSKEEALNQAFKGNQNEGENNIIQELTRAIVGEVKRMSGNDSCCDCGAAGQGGGVSCTVTSQQGAIQMFGSVSD